MNVMYETDTTQEIQNNPLKMTTI